MNLAHFLSGIYIFIFALSLLEDALKHLAGRPFKKFLQHYTENKLKAIVGGTLVTAVLQSSSVVLLMVLSFVGAGIMTMRNAIAVTLGANLGTTLDSWVVATIGFKVELDTISYPVLAVALCIHILLPAREKLKYISLFLVGFALLFIGLEWMKISAQGLIAEMDINRYAHWPPHLFILVGLAITAIIQSSSATMAITLTALYHGIIPFENAAAIIIGSETGTTLKILLSSYGGIPDKKRVALGNFIFNLLLSILAGIFLFPLVHIIQHILRITDPLIGLVTFQTGINITFIIIAYPFIGKFTTLLQKTYRSQDEVSATQYIQSATTQFPDTALKAAEKETLYLMLRTIRFNRNILGLAEKGNPSFLQHLKSLIQKDENPETEYSKLKQIHGEILDFLLGIRKEDMTATEMEQTGKLLAIARYNIHASKNLKDIRHNIHELDVSINDSLHGLLDEIRQSEKIFYDQLERLALVSLSPQTVEKAEKMLQDCKTSYNTMVERALHLLSTGKIPELDLSTLLNIFRELYSSQKSLLTGIKELAETDLTEIS